MTEDYSIRFVEEAERLIAAGETPAALDKLKKAADSVPWWWSKADSAPLMARIEDLADGIARADPSYEQDVLAINDVLASRGRAHGIDAGDREPWFYGAADTLGTVAIVASVLSLVVGIVVGVQASQYTPDFGGPTAHHAGVLVLGIVSGVSAAAGWLVLAVVLRLLADNGRMLRALRGQS